MPADTGCLLSSLYVAPVLAAILSGLLMPLLSGFRNSGAASLYVAGLLFASAGIVLLFLARLPLYRDGRFLSVGPGALDRKHRRFCWLAYALILVALLLFAAIAYWR